MASAAICLAVAVLGSSMARGPVSRYFRFAAIGAVADALYCLTDFAQAAQTPLVVITWSGRLSLVAACAHAAAWLAFLSAWSKQPLSRLARGMILANVACGVLSLVPGISVGAGVTVRSIASIGVVYQDPEIGPLASPIMAVVYVAEILAVRVALRARASNPRAKLVAAALALGCLATAVDWLSAVHLLALPSVVGLALAAVPLTVAACVAADAADDARALVEKSAQLELARTKLGDQERLAALGELAAVVAHEVRNPVTIIYGAVGALRRGSHDADSSELLGILEQEATRLRRLVSQLLDVVRPFELQYSERTLAEIVRGAAALAASGAAADPSEVELDGEPADRIQCDEVLVGQAISNLVSNALAAPRRRSPVRLRARIEGSERAMARVEVIDDGEGVSAEHLDRLFSPFFTTRATGTGLGLALSRRIATAHGGSVEHHAPEQGGACFVLLIPQRARPTNGA